MAKRRFEYKPAAKTQGVQSVYNEAALQIVRLHNLWSRVHTAYLGGRIDDVNFLLSRVWVELSADATRLGKEKWWGEYKRCQMKIVMAKQKKDKNLLLYYIEQKELFLKELQYSCGKGSTYKEDRTRLSF